jgi:hypothetical protein
MKSHITYLFQYLCIAIIWCHFGTELIAGPDNIAPLAKVSTSTDLDSAHAKSRINDGIIGVSDLGEWACEGETVFWGYIRYPWVQLTWNEKMAIDRIILYDRPDEMEHTAGGTLFFSDGSEVAVTGRACSCRRVGSPLVHATNAHLHGPEFKR